MKRRTLLMILALVVAATAWYIFRPELLFLNAKVDEQFPAAEASSQSTVLLAGTFHDVAHKGAGTATIHKLDDGSRVLRFMDFETSNGPDVRVYLVAASDAKDNDTVTHSGFVDLGSLKGNIGNQNYDIPPEVDINKYHSVAIWCRRFGVNFATAPLASQ